MVDFDRDNQVIDEWRAYLSARRRHLVATGPVLALIAAAIWLLSVPSCGATSDIAWGQPATDGERAVEVRWPNRLPNGGAVRIAVAHPTPGTATLYQDRHEERPGRVALHRLDEQRRRDEDEKGSVFRLNVGDLHSVKNVDSAVQLVVQVDRPSGDEVWRAIRYPDKHVPRRFRSGTDVLDEAPNAEPTWQRVETWPYRQYRHLSSDRGLTGGWLLGALGLVSMIGSAIYTWRHHRVETLADAGYRIVHRSNLIRMSPVVVFACNPIPSHLFFPVGALVATVVSLLGAGWVTQRWWSRPWSGRGQWCWIVLAFSSVSGVAGFFLAFAGASLFYAGMFAVAAACIVFAVETAFWRPDPVESEVKPELFSQIVHFLPLVTMWAGLGLASFT